ncbi:aldehyde dehydrogenase, partial [Candidatus Gracilibacteria bacterium]|nr:aldehyde dehydrogenase [Candidatus Gracilibacteria bacterium]
MNRLYVFGEVVLLKMNPINAGVGPLLEQVFAPFVEAGYLRICYGGAEVGAYLVEHAGIEAVHITGSVRTHDAIVFGPGAEGAERKRRHTPRLHKPISSELGGICPVIILPGTWSKADIAYQAEQVATMRLLNNGYTCVAAQVLITSRSWPQRAEFMDALRAIFRRVAPRADYYPGGDRRLQAVLEQHPAAERFTHDPLRTIIGDVDPCNHDEISFREEFFAPILAETALAGDDAASYLRNAVQFCNERLVGTLGATLLGHPTTMRALGPAVEAAVDALHYGVIGVNEWHGAAFSLAQAPWGGYPGASIYDVQSGVGVVHNSLFFDRPEKTVIRGSFYAFPRGVLHGDFALFPRQPWLIA